MGRVARMPPRMAKPHRPIDSRMVSSARLNISARKPLVMELAASVTYSQRASPLVMMAPIVENPVLNNVVRPKKTFSWNEFMVGCVLSQAKLFGGRLFGGRLWLRWRDEDHLAV